MAQEEGRRVPFDVGAYATRVARGCFVCRLAGGADDAAHDVVFDDAETIVFLNRYPTTRGQLLVAPRRHVEHLARDLDEEAYVRLQRVVHRAAVALEAVVPSARTYVASLGSQEANAHLHVHVAVLAPGTPSADQQLAALDAERVGVLELPREETARIAAGLRRRLRTS